MWRDGDWNGFVGIALAGLLASLVELSRSVISTDRRSLRKAKSLDSGDTLCQTAADEGVVRVPPDALSRLPTPLAFSVYRPSDFGLPTRPYSVYRLGEFGRPTWSFRWTDRGNSVDRLCRLGLPSLAPVKGAPVCLDAKCCLLGSKSRGALWGV